MDNSGFKPKVQKPEVKSRLEECHIGLRDLDANDDRMESLVESLFSVWFEKGND